MAQLSVPYMSFQWRTVINPDQVNASFKAIQDWANGNIGTTNITDGSITDPKIGNRTVVPASPTTDTAQIGVLINNIADRLNNITGKNDWKVAPDKSIAQLITDTYTKTDLTGGALDGRYYTETELQNGSLDSRYYTETEISGTGGSAIIGAGYVAGITGATVHEQITDIKRQMNNMVVGNFPQGAVLDNMLEVQKGQSVTLPHGLSILNISRSTRLKPKFTGRQLVNLLGKDGNCEDVSKWSTSASSLALDNTLYTNGHNSIKITSTTTGIANAYYFVNLTQGKYYIILGNVRNGNFDAGIKIRFLATGDNLDISDAYNTSTSWKLNYVKVSPLDFDTATDTRVYIQGNTTVVGQYGYFDGIRVYEITAQEYSQIDTLTPTQIEAKYPYVDSFQCVQNPAVTVQGENVFNDTLATNSLFQSGATTENGYIKFTGSGISSSEWVRIKVVPNTNYTCSAICYSDGNIDFVSDVKTFDGTLLYSGAFKVAKAVTTPTKRTVTFNSGNNTELIINKWAGNGTGTFWIKELMINIGDTALSFKPYNPSYLYLQTPLYDSETLEEIDGQWVQSKLYEKLVLDGNLSYSHLDDFAGFKRVNVPLAKLGNWQGTMVKYDGKILVKSSSAPTSGDILNIQNVSPFTISVSDKDTGFGESYIPTADEWKAFFLGWRMYKQGTAGTLYDGTGNKSWAKIYCGVGTSAYGGGGTVINPVVVGSGVDNICPTTMNDQGFTPYTLHYPLATPTTEVIPFEGQLVLREGANQVEVTEGVVVKELSTTVVHTDGSTYYINRNDGAVYPISDCKNKVDKILAVYNGSLLDYNWLPLATTNAYGKELAYVRKEQFDTTAQYFTTYKALPEEFTAPLLSVDCTYDTNIKSTVDTLVYQLAEISTDVQALDMALRNKGLLQKSANSHLALTTTTAIANSTYTKIIFNSSNFDNGKIVQNYVPIIKTPGRYFALMILSFQSNSTGIRGVSVSFNGSQVSIEHKPAINSGQTYDQYTFPFMLGINSSTELSFNAYQNSGVSLNLQVATLHIVRVGD